MAGYNAQHQRNIDAMSPPEPDERDYSDALDAIGTRLFKSCDLYDVLADMHGDGDLLDALDRLICGRAKTFGDERVLQDLLRRVKALHEAVEVEMHG